MVLAYSIGKDERKDTSVNPTSKIVPGPGTYESKKDAKKAAPKWQFGTGTRPGMVIS